MNKNLITITGLIVMFLCLFIYFLFYTYLLNNNMEVCMNHYKDFNYCETKVND